MSKIRVKDEKLLHITLIAYDRLADEYERLRRLASNLTHPVACLDELYKETAEPNNDDLVSLLRMDVHIAAIKSITAALEEGADIEEAKK
ncbi:MAG: hypothetical protein P1R58_13550 [bacterium]|nr:hypothetical protein [bacterium]